MSGYNFKTETEEFVEVVTKEFYSPNHVMFNTAASQEVPIGTLVKAPAGSLIFEILTDEVHATGDLYGIVKNTFTSAGGDEARGDIMLTGVFVEENSSMESTWVHRDDILHGMYLSNLYNV